MRCTLSSYWQKLIAYRCTAEVTISLTSVTFDSTAYFSLVRPQPGLNGFGRAVMRLGHLLVASKSTVRMRVGDSSYR